MPSEEESKYREKVQKKVERKKIWNTYIYSCDQYEDNTIEYAGVWQSVPPPPISHLHPPNLQTFENILSCLLKHITRYNIGRKDVGIKVCLGSKYCSNIYFIRCLTPSNKINMCTATSTATVCMWGGGAKRLDDMPVFCENESILSLPEALGCPPFNPTTEGVEILWFGGGGVLLKPPPKKSMMEWA